MCRRHRQLQVGKKKSTQTGAITQKDYVITRNDAYCLIGTRVSLDSVVYVFLRGQSPESIVDSLPTVTLEQVYGTLAYYLANQTTVDAYLHQGEAEFVMLRESRQKRNAPL